MKNNVYFFGLFCCFLMLFSSCSSDDESNDTNTLIIMQVREIAQTDSWRITSFVDSGQDETNDFTAYTFTFNSNGTLTASNGSNQVNGVWSVTDSSNSSDDSSSDDDIDFNISFNVGTSNVFFDLNDDWDIVSYTSNTISLRDVSGGNGGTDTLVFQKNN